MKGNENCFELAGGSSYGGFELPEVDCISLTKISYKIYGDRTVVLTTTTMHKYSILLTSKTQFI